MNLLRMIDDALNRITMYRVILYGLGIVLAFGVGLSFSGQIPLSGSGLLISLTILLTVGFCTAQVLAWVYRSAPNFESSLITVLILACIVPPTTSVERGVAVGLAAIVAIASKYLLVYRHTHIFNPAAFGAVALSLAGLLPATWWVANPTLFPVLLIVGLLVVRKVRRLQMVGVFVLVGLATMLAVGVAHDEQLAQVVRNAFLSWPLVFMGTTMLTEPATAPHTHYDRMLYAVLVGVLFGAQLDLGPISTTPQLALLVGNIYAFAVNPRQTHKLKLLAKSQLTPQVYDFVFEKPANFAYRAGQYMEWTLPRLWLDTRGNRRSFTLASSPTESTVRLGVKFYTPSSRYKHNLRALEPGQHIKVSQLGGDFTLKENQTKLAFVAGGIGITPFRSMVTYLQDMKLERDCVLFYLVPNMLEAAYHQELEAAASVGVRLVYVVAEGDLPKDQAAYKGFLTTEVIQAELEDIQARVWFISGPNGMVRHAKGLLRSLGVSPGKIKTDYFAGY